MKLTLLTYDSIVVHNAGYAFSCKATEMTKILTDLANEFSKIVGCPLDAIYWKEVDNSDWCNRMIMIYTKVDKDWKPITDTSIWDESYDPNWYGNLVTSFSDFIQGRGVHTNITKNPAENPHSLFRTVEK